LQFVTQHWLSQHRSVKSIQGLVNRSINEVKGEHLFPDGSPGPYTFIEPYDGGWGGVIAQNPPFQS